VLVLNISFTHGNVQDLVPPLHQPPQQEVLSTLARNFSVIVISLDTRQEPIDVMVWLFFIVSTYDSPTF